MANMAFSWHICRMWNIQESKDVDRLNGEKTDQFNLVSEGCNPKSVSLVLVSIGLIGL
jgi:hypothetical protein